MNHRITLASTGAEITLGRTCVRAVSGPHTGSWWRVDEIRSVKGVHRVYASRRTRAGRQKRFFAPEIFGLLVEELTTWTRHALNVACHVRRKFDDGIILGALALVPLALFEAFHGGEYTRHLIEMLFNSRANGGGGEH